MERACDCKLHAQRTLCGLMVFGCFWQVQALLPDSSLPSLLASSTFNWFLKLDNSIFISCASVTLVHNFLVKPNEPTMRPRFVLFRECLELGSEINALIV